jgi:phosphohistidine phosphatase
MRIFIMRHGPAEEAGPASSDDRARPLSMAGRKDTRRAARGLYVLGIAKEIRAILTSPLLRARETAEIVARELDLERSLRETETLAPGFSRKALGREVEEAAEGAGALVVGHEPDMGELVAWLLAGRADGVATPMKKAGVACLEAGRDALGGGGGATLIWFATPAMLRAIGASGER